MVTSKLPSPSVSKSNSRPHTSKSTIRLHLAKAIRRTLRNLRTELRLFLLRPAHRRPWTLPLLFIIILLLLFILLFNLLFPIFAPILTFYEPRRETHFTHQNHVTLPRPETYETIRSRPCSWIYLEFGAKDGRHIDSFFTEGNKVLEEFLRGTQSAMKAFCAVAFEPDPALLPTLKQVRLECGRRSRSFDIFTQFVPGARDATEMLKFRSDDTGNIPVEEVPATSIPLRQFLLNVTFPLDHDGVDVSKMITARGNGNIGTVVVRFNDLTAPQALWYLDLMQAGQTDGVLCTRVDRLVLDFEKIRLDVESLKGHVQNREVVRDWARVTTSPSDRMFLPTDDMTAVVKLAHEINTRESCRTTVHVLDGAGKMIVPSILKEDEIMYAILAGEPTFNERVDAQTKTWMKSIQQDRLTIFTNAERSEEDMKAAGGRNVAVVHPYRPEVETHLPLMQSWSHLVRVRESWDRTMRDNPNIKWLLLVDDDTFVFPGGMRQYLSSFDPRILLWGGSGEQARIDNGDTGQFAFWLRRTHERHGGKHCYLKTEPIPRHLKGVHIEYMVSKVLNGRRVAKKVSHMCEDTFCLRGCPAVPQGAAIFMSRALVKAVRPHIETCERDTSKLCRNCGSQRLYMCVNRFTRGPRTLLTRGFCRSPWKLEHREHWPFALTYHGFNRYKGMTRSTRSLSGDMQELWGLGKTQEEAVRRGFQASYYVRIEDVANKIACKGKGRYQEGVCIGENGKVFPSKDGKPKEGSRGYRGNSRRKTTSKQVQQDSGHGKTAVHMKKNFAHLPPPPPVPDQQPPPPPQQQ